MHYPTDSTLLQDGVPLLTRTMQRVSTALGDAKGQDRNRLRSVWRRVLLIGYQARSPKTQAALVQSYRKLMATTRAVVRDAARMIRRLGKRRRTASRRVRPVLEQTRDQLRPMRPPVQRLLAQTRARILGGDTHVPDKVLSISEPHTETIRKGKIAPPNEFGQLVTIQESEHQIITAFEVHAKRPADSTSWESARWFRRGQRWRVGSDGRISVLKRRHGLDRCRYHGLEGMRRWVGLGVIANNLVITATFSGARDTA